jgi:hypothetical protein
VPDQARGGRASIVSAIVAGGYSSAFLASAPDEFPEQRGHQLLDRCPSKPLSLSCPLSFGSFILAWVQSWQCLNGTNRRHQSRLLSMRHGLAVLHAQATGGD